MRRITPVLALAALLPLAGCKDTDLRAKLKPYFQEQYDWGVKVRNAVCQLEADVYDVANSAGDTRAAGPATDPGSNRLCSDGPGEPGAGMPPQPPDLE